MRLVLCESYDVAALWAWKGLRRRLGDGVEVVSADMLRASRNWCHRVSAGGVDTEFTLPDGRTLNGDAIQGVLNRLSWLAAPLPGPSSPEDRLYAAQEFAALCLSWLRSLEGPVLNPPTPAGMSGRWRHQSEWVTLAARAGFATHPYHLTSRRPLAEQPGGPAAAPEALTTLFAVAGDVVGAPTSGDIRDACARLAGLADTPLLGVNLGWFSGQWHFMSATSQPDLRLGGTPLLDRLATALR